MSITCCHTRTLRRGGALQGVSKGEDRLGLALSPELPARAVHSYRCHAVCEIRVKHSPLMLGSRPLVENHSSLHR